MRIRPLWITVLLAWITVAHGFKILMTIPKFGYSHMMTMGKLADILVELGHDVTFLMPVSIEIPSNGTTLAKVILIPPSDEVIELNKKEMASGAVARLWKHSANSKQGIMWSTGYLGQSSYLNTKLMLGDSKLIEDMKNEKFDIGITELFDFSGIAFFHAINLKNVVGLHTTSVFEGTMLSTGAPILPSFVPGSQTFTDDSGSLTSRIWNIYMTYWSYKFQDSLAFSVQKAMDEHFGKKNSPKVWDLVKDITWFFVNSDPIFDFPKPLPHNIVEIGGISVSKVSPLEQKWDEILNRRSKNVLISFGSIASPVTMPDNVKTSILDTIAAFPDVTFIWKFDESEKHRTAHLNNIEIVNWMPQNDLLADKRITAFWTHGGMGSLLESAKKAVPLMVVPIFGDQMRNAQIAKRHGIATIYDKMDLSNTKKLIAALKELLENENYKKSATLLARILATERIPTKEKIRETIQLAGEFGPMPRWTGSSKNFSFIKYFNIDLVLILLIFVFILVASFVFGVRYILVKLGIISTNLEKVKPE